jgi:hypothetical protein
MQETVCIRCGKTRIFAKKWSEKTDKGQIITHEVTVCPDIECQKAVDKHFADIREKKMNMINAKAAAALASAKSS